MKFKLYFRGQFQSAHDDFEDAEAQARYTYFEFRSCAWEGLEMPPGFMILVPQIEPTLNLQDNKVMCS